MKSLWNGTKNIFNGVKKGVSDMLVNAPSYAKAPLGVAMAITTGPFAEVLATGTVAYGYTHPENIVKATYWGEVINDVFNESMPAITPHGAAIDIAIKGYMYGNYK